MEAGIHAGAAPEAAVHTQLQEGGLADAARAAAFYASIAYVLEALGFPPGEAGDLFLDTVAAIVSSSSHLVYAEGVAELASMKRRPGWWVAGAGEDYVEALVGYIASPSCSMPPTEVIEDLAVLLGLSEDAKRGLLQIASRGCGEGKHAVAALLLVPPRLGGGPGA